MHEKVPENFKYLRGAKTDGYTTRVLPMISVMLYVNNYSTDINTYAFFSQDGARYTKVAWQKKGITLIHPK